MNPSKFDPKAVFSAPIVHEAGKPPTRLQRLAGVDDIINKLADDLHFIFHPHMAAKWSEKCYKKSIPLIALLEDMVPLVIFEGDVGTGKTEVAETIGSKLAFDHKYSVQTLRMSTQVRGTGYVGEMTSLLSSAFSHVKSLAQKNGMPTILIIDEADSLLTSRVATGQHHEDKAGVNTVLQHVDELKASPVPISVIAISNRPGALDPAIGRRATAVFQFKRPNAEQRHEVYSKFLRGMEFSDNELKQLVEKTAERLVKTSAGPMNLGFSYADLTLRFLLPVLRAAVIKQEKITFGDLMSRLEHLAPSAPLLE